jgi:hypothetical protein
MKDARHGKPVGDQLRHSLPREAVFPVDRQLVEVILSAYPTLSAELLIEQLATRVGCAAAKSRDEVGADPGPGKPGLSAGRYWYRLLTLVFSPRRIQTAELDERLARIERTSVTPRPISPAGALGLSYNAMRAIISRRSLLSRRGRILRLQRQREAGL